MGFSHNIEPLPGSGYGGKGIGAPIFVGRNRTISLTLDVTDAPSNAIASVYLETSSTQVSGTRWRKLGAAVTTTGVASTLLNATNADAFIRARYDITGLVDVDAIGLSLTGQAQCVLVESASFFGNGTSAAFDLAQYHGGRFVVSVTGIPGLAQSLDITIERSADGSSWETSATLPTITDVGEYAIESADLDRFVRVRRVSASINPWTFGVAGTAHLIYAHARDRSLEGIREGAIPNANNPAQVLKALMAATAIIVTYYSRYDHPLRAWDSDTSKATIALSDWELLTSRSKDPARLTEGGSTYFDAVQRWTAHLALVGGVGVGVGGRKLNPSGIIDSAPPNEQGEVKRYEIRSNPNPYGQGNGYGGGV